MFQTYVSLICIGWAFCFQSLSTGNRTLCTYHNGIDISSSIKGRLVYDHSAFFALIRLPQTVIKPVFKDFTTIRMDKTYSTIKQEKTCSELCWYCYSRYVNCNNIKRFSSWFIFFISLSFTKHFELNTNSEMKFKEHET